MKYSKLLHAVSILEFTKENYVHYWNTQYIRSSKKTKWYDSIIKEINNKFKNNLTTYEEMVKLIKNSHDSTTDKGKALKLLKIKESD